MIPENKKQPVGKIYITTNTINGKQYIGQTIKINSKAYKGSGTLIKKDFLKYGKDAPNYKKKDEQVECPHCGKIAGKPPMIRWHFDNCKYK